MCSYTLCVQLLLENYIAYLFNLSISTFFIPQEWKSAWISPIPYVPALRNLSDFGSISILSRTMKRLVVRPFLCPVFIGDIPQSQSFLISLPK